MENVNYLIIADKLIEEDNSYSISNADLALFLEWLDSNNKVFINYYIVKFLDKYKIDIDFLSKLFDTVLSPKYSFLLKNKDLFTERKNIIQVRYLTTKYKVLKLKSLDKELLNNNFNNLFNLIFDEDEARTYQVINPLIEDYNVEFLFQYLKERDRKRCINDHYEIVFNHARKFLTNDEINYIKNTYNLVDDFVKGEDRSSLENYMIHNKSSLLTKLKKYYGKSYVLKTNKSLSDEEEFVFTILNSNVLKKLYLNPVFTYNDTKVISGLISYFEGKGRDVSRIRQKHSDFLNKLLEYEKYLFNYIMTNKNKRDLLTLFLEKNNITKDNFTSFVVSRKYLDKTMKDALLIVLSNYFHIKYLSISEVLAIVEESYKKEIPFNKILKDKEIDENTFRNFLTKLKIEKYDIYLLIERYINHKELDEIIILYNSLMSDSVTDLMNFKFKYNSTPEKVLGMFINTSLFDDVFDKFSSWHSFKDSYISKVKLLRKDNN